MLAGHYDTVPAQENVPGRIEDGSVVGLGASDMKGGLAVMLELARALDERGVEPAVDLALLAFGKEELPAEDSPLPALFDRSRLVHEAELAILLEPTDNTIQAGCLGNLNARIVFHGVSGHSARPWTAENAIDKALEGLRAVRRDRAAAGRDRRAHVHRGREHHADRGRDREQRDPRPRRANVNFRYAPDRSPSSADAYLRSLVPEGATLRARRRLSPGARRHRLGARPAAAERRRPGARAEAGVDERRRLHRARDRRGQLRTGRDAVRAPARRAGRDRRARAVVRGALGLRHG